MMKVIKTRKLFFFAERLRYYTICDKASLASSSSPQSNSCFLCFLLLLLYSLFLFPLQATQFSITYLPFSGPEEHIPGRRTVTQLIENANISSHTFSFSKVNNHLPYFGKYIREMHEGIHQQLANDFPSPFALQSCCKIPEKEKSNLEQTHLKSGVT